MRSSRCSIGSTPSAPWRAPKRRKPRLAWTPSAWRSVRRSRRGAPKCASDARRPNGYRSAAVTGADRIERIAQVSYDSGERGILELLDAYRTGASARVRQAALDAAERQAGIGV